MKTHLPDINHFEQQVFKIKNPLALLLSFSLNLLGARHVGLLYGTDRSGIQFLSPERWDRACIHSFDGQGGSGFVLKYFGKPFINLKGLSPILFYKESHMGERKEQDGIIPFVLRKHKDFYKKGSKILIIDDIQAANTGSAEKAYQASISSYNGKLFYPLKNLKINTAIVKLFKADNFISAYIPDFGAIVFNTIDPELLKKNKGVLIHESMLKDRLNILISAIEMASLANIGLAKGSRAAHIIWRKEKKLRKTAMQLKEKETELNAQKSYLRAVGAVNARQLNMEALNISDGVYAFMDMVGSATIRKRFIPKDYFFILNLCFQIAADNANRFGCRVDNFIGDSVFLQNTSVFDDLSEDYHTSTEERGMLLITSMGSFFNEIELLKKGCHPLDTAGRVKQLIENAQVDLDFRAGVEIGSAMIGPLGSQKRKIVTAIGKAVNNASRLESSGVPKNIHISQDMMTLLENAYVSGETRIIQQTLSTIKDNKDIFNQSGARFLYLYQQVFGIDDPIIEQRQNVSFKEFSKKVSYLVRTLPKVPDNVSDK